MGLAVGLRTLWRVERAFLSAFVTTFCPKVPEKVPRIFSAT
jgi:hypothetical protein